MINIEVEVKINGAPIKVSGKLNDLVAWFITQKLVSDDSTVAGFANTTQKSGTVPKKQSHGGKVNFWTEEQRARLLERVRTLEQQGLKDGEIGKTLQPEFGRTAVAINLVIYRYRRSGVLAGINSNN
jgi:hypothetical protein